MIIKQLRAHKRPFFIFSSYKRSECFILWSETEQCFIAEWNGAASYCGALAEQCFIVRRFLWSILRRCRKIWSAAYAAWSGTACHEAKPDGFTFFAHWAKKWSGYGDSNSGPFDPQSNALNQAALYPDCLLIYTAVTDISSRIGKFLQTRRTNHLRP